MPENPAGNCSATQERLGVDRCCLSYEEKKKRKKERKGKKKTREAVMAGRSVICLHIVLHAVPRTGGREASERREMQRKMKWTGPSRVERVVDGRLRYSGLIVDLMHTLH